MQTVREIIDNGANNHPGKPFLHATDGVEGSLNWAELQSHSRQINALLDKENIAPGETVSFLLDNGYWTTLLLLGVMYSGRVVLALNALSGPEALSYVTDHSDAKLIFTNQHYQSKFTDVRCSPDSH
jgi:acyl-CoA synthetase (AMP-forming)/AMP-acid ligase II